MIRTFELDLSSEDSGLEGLRGLEHVVEGPEGLESQAFWKRVCRQNVLKSCHCTHCLPAAM